jgi:hypothetical protein
MKMIKRLERLKNTVNKYMADLRPDRHTSYQSERKLAVSRGPVSIYLILPAALGPGVRSVSNRNEYRKH